MNAKSARRSFACQTAMGASFLKRSPRGQARADRMRDPLRGVAGSMESHGQPPRPGHSTVARSVVKRIERESRDDVFGLGVVP